MAKYIKKKDLKRAIEVCTWYHIGKNGELVEGAGVDDEPFYKESDICRIIKDLPTRKINDEANEPYIDIETGILHWQGWKYRRIGDCRDTADTPQTETQTETQNSNLTFEKQTDCETCKHWKYIAKEWQCESYKCQGYEPKDEPQTDDPCEECVNKTDCPWK